jgi:ABC-type nitrate/sulfonate/bicarbonate transport system substrate-binding protein
VHAWKFRAVPLAAAAVTALAVAGCPSASNNATLSGLEETNVTMAALPTADLAGLYVAQDNGFKSMIAPGP